MINVIILFPKEDIAKSIRGLLIKNGIPVTAICSTGAQVIHAIDDLDYGLVVCSYRYVDMVYSELLSYLPDTFEMLLIASKSQRAEIDESEIVCLRMPFKGYELVETTNYMLEHIAGKRKRQKEMKKSRSDEEAAVIVHAKTVLMNEKGWSEEEAHRYLQKKSMDNGQNMVLTARDVLDIY